MVKAGLYLAVVISLSVLMNAQGPNAPSAAVSAEQLNAPSSLAEHPAHKFWDRETAILFGLHAGLEAADFGLTHHALAEGAVERNPLARPFTNLGTGGQVAFFAGGTAATLGISYWLHKRGHHRMERLIGLYSIGDSAFGVIHNATHLTHNPAAPLPSR